MIRSYRAELAKLLRPRVVLIARCRQVHVDHAVVMSVT